MKVIVGFRELVVASLLLNAGILSAEKIEDSTTNGDKHGKFGNRFLRVHQEERMEVDKDLMTLAKQIQELVSSRRRQDVGSSSNPKLHGIQEVVPGPEHSMAVSNWASRGDPNAMADLDFYLRDVSSEDIIKYFRPYMEDNYVLKESVEAFIGYRKERDREYVLLTGWAFHGNADAKAKLQRILEDTSSEEIKAHFRPYYAKNHDLKKWVDKFISERNQKSHV
ncbi:hypothetical protein PsorP6_015742 [Peronosclerospora sorghi]|uniref:Uncharacterized protein n=1 Tax=Peronosclerospora sorghi TaxID=230839 RepID=A0ACC0WP86_9STRA|nr:hypothetical protein PsorP6_015742 [Peronosclerospora sorghi]